MPSASAGDECCGVKTEDRNFPIFKLQKSTFVLNFCKYSLYFHMRPFKDCLEFSGIIIAWIRNLEGYRTLGLFNVLFYYVTVTAVLEKESLLVKFKYLNLLFS